MPAHPVDIYIGKRLHFRRITLGLSQSVVGKAIGVTFQQVQKYEKGANRMSGSMLHEFSKQLSVPVSYFFNGYDTEMQPGEEKMEGNKEILELVRGYKAIASEKTRKEILSLIRAIGENSSIVSS